MQDDSQNVIRNDKTLRYVNLNSCTEISLLGYT